MNEIDILNIDMEIQEKFKIEESKLNEYKQKLNESLISIQSINLTTRFRNQLTIFCNELETHISNIESHSIINFYTLETETILERYREILYTPVKTRFIGKVTKNNLEKKKIINEYIDIVKKYTCASGT